MPDPLTEDELQSMIHLNRCELGKELHRLRSQVTRMCGELATAYSPPSAKETQDALDELMELVPHAATCELTHPREEAPLCQPICDCGVGEREDKLEALILRLATGNAERLAAAEAVLDGWEHKHSDARDGRKGNWCDILSSLGWSPGDDVPQCTCGLSTANAKWQSLRGGGDNG